MVQQKWMTKMYFIVVPTTPLTLSSSVNIQQKRWDKSDWLAFTKFFIGQFSTVSTDNIEGLASVYADFLISNNLQFSPKLVKESIAEFGHLHGLKKNEMDQNYEKLTLVCDRITKARLSKVS
jgi:hypothetical protein